jgi:type IV pilus assembly protein PilO
MAIETGLEGKPWYVAAGVAAGIAVVLVVAAKYMKIDDMKLQIAAQERQLTELQKKINEGRTAQASLPQFREEVQRLELELEKLLRILPTRRNMEDLLRRLRALAEQGDLELVRISPRPPTPQDFYSVWPIQIAINGGYHNLALLFDRIGRFSRIINIEDLDISANNDRVGRHSIRATFTAKTFLYNEPEPREGAGATGAAR